MMKTQIFQTTALLGCISFLMSATKCEQPADGSARSLKKNIKLMQLDTTKALDGSGFNFSEVAQSQFSGVLFEKNYFFERNVYPTTDDINLEGQNYFGVKKASADALSVNPTAVQIKKWFPLAKTQNLAFSRNSSCLISRPQHFIAGKINALEAWGGGALQLGINAAGVQLPISADFKMDKMRMDLSFHAFNPWTQQLVSSVNEEAFKTDYKVGFGIDLGIIHIGPELYRTMGMAEVTLKGLQVSVESLAKKLLATSGEDWSTRIIYSGDNNVVILGGAELGLKNGDQLKVYNQIHTWNGEACGDSSILTGSTIVSDTNDPWIIQIEDAGTLMSKARVLNIKEDTSIDLGALVKLHKFTEQVQAEAAQAAKPK